MLLLLRTKGEFLELILKNKYQFNIFPGSRNILWTQTSEECYKIDFCLFLRMAALAQLCQSDCSSQQKLCMQPYNYNRAGSSS